MAVADLESADLQISDQLLSLMVSGRAFKLTRLGDEAIGVSLPGRGRWTPAVRWQGTRPGAL